METAQQVTVSPANGASLRTRNRIREHGPVFQVVAGPRTPIFSPHTGPWLMVKSANITDTWEGWLPLSEIDTAPFEPTSTEKFRRLDEEVKAAGLPTLHEVPCVEYWADLHLSDPDAVTFEEINPERFLAVFTDEAWERLKVCRWTETADSREIVDTEYRFTLRYEDIETEYRVTLQTLTERRVWMPVNQQDVFVCEATYDIEMV